ncbi:MAG: F0F1 ATP synthase subunit delta [Propionibacteriaceae bacterium]|jgi:F-type H+-transporting ATPase subunit delta|nr:F0F1 ATP synthase subunit delta [Propionibacteriaceae bacterium]
MHDIQTMAVALQEYPALSRALTDPATAMSSKTTLIDDLFAASGESARQVLKEAIGRTWESNQALTLWVQAEAVRAGWQWAADTQTLSQSIDQVFSFGRMMYDDHELREAVTDRNVDLGRRQALVRELLTRTMTAPAVAICVMAVGSARGTIDAAVRAFVHQGAKQANATLAVVTVARSLDDDQKARLTAALSKRLGKSVIVEEVVDPAVLAGVRVECGSDVIDDTVQARLQAARRDFV